MCLREVSEESIGWADVFSDNGIDTGTYGILSVTRG